MENTKALADFTARCILDRCDKGHMPVDIGLEALAKDHLVLRTQLAERDAQLAAAQDKVTYLERVLHDTLHGKPKPTKDCQRFCFISFTKYKDGTYGHTTSGMLNPAEAMMAVYGRSAIENEACKLLEQAITATRTSPTNKGE